MSPSLPQPLTLAHPQPAGGCLQVSFHWDQDRFAQQISGATADGRQTEIWQAILPGDDAERQHPWPPSPPLQELSREIIDGRELLLGVGRAGIAHWSVSIETRIIDGHPVLYFDYACRSSQPPDWLGASYRRLAPPPQPHGNPPLAVQTTHTPAVAALSVICRDDTNWQTTDQGDWVIRPRQLPSRWPATGRWRFAIGLDRGASGLAAVSAG